MAYIITPYLVAINALIIQYMVEKGGFEPPKVVPTDLQIEDYPSIIGKKPIFDTHLTLIDFSFFFYTILDYTIFSPLLLILYIFF